MRRLVRWLATVAMIAVLAYLLAGRHNWGQPPPAARLLPDLAGYRQLEGQTITAYLGSLAEGAALLAGQPAAALKIAAVDRVVSCYQDVGAVRVRLYSQRETPLSAGGVAVVDADALTDPANLAACAATEELGQAPAEDDPEQPCAGSFTVANDDGLFHVAYAGTRTAVCQDICAAMQGCGRPVVALPTEP